ncbi:MAG: hypothetical protein KJN67_03325 [Pontiella sp.]|nr:hypothetical protein [Pontiella sp.]
MKRRIHLLNCLAATLVLTGCMGYRLGGSLPEGITTVAVAPVVNKTSEPAIELQITHALRERIQFDGRLKLVDNVQQADAVIEVALSAYQLNPIAFRTDLRTTPELYRVRISGNAELKKVATGKVIASSTTFGESVFEFKSDLTSSKRDALPAAASEIARLMVDDLIEQW